MFTKLVNRPKLVIDTEQLKEGTKIHYSENTLYTEDEGDGEIEFVCEDYMLIRYDGYYPNTTREITAKMLHEDSGAFFNIEILAP